LAVKKCSKKHIEKWTATAGHGGGVGGARLRGDLKTPVLEYSVWVSKWQHHWVMGRIQCLWPTTATALTFGFGESRCRCCLFGCVCCSQGGGWGAPLDLQRQENKDSLVRSFQIFVSMLVEFGCVWYHFWLPDGPWGSLGAPLGAPGAPLQVPEWKSDENYGSFPPVWGRLCEYFF